MNFSKLENEISSEAIVMQGGKLIFLEFFRYSSGEILKSEDELGFHFLHHKMKFKISVFNSLIKTIPGTLLSLSQ